MAKAYFMQKNIYSEGQELPPRKTDILMIGSTLSFNLDDYDDDDNIDVMDEDGDWFVVKKKDIVFI